MFVEHVEGALEATGLYRRLDRPPAMCFLDLTGYTRLTEERGDDAAADLAARIAEYARPGEVLVSQEVVDAADGGPVTFTEIGARSRSTAGIVGCS